MKAYHNYTTAMTTAFRLRWGMATLLILAALITAQAVQPALASPKADARIRRNHVICVRTNPPRGEKFHDPLGS